MMVETYGKCTEARWCHLEKYFFRRPPEKTLLYDARTCFNVSFLGVVDTLLFISFIYNF